MFLIRVSPFLISISSFILPLCTVFFFFTSVSFSLNLFTFSPPKTIVIFSPSWIFYFSYYIFQFWIQNWHIFIYGFILFMIFWICFLNVNRLLFLGGFKIHIYFIYIVLCYLCSWASQSFLSHWILFNVTEETFQSFFICFIIGV